MTQAPWDAASSDAEAGSGAGGAGDDDDVFARRPSVDRILACMGLGLLLFVGTLGVGYLIWSVVTWGSGQTPAQRMLGLRCVDLRTGQMTSRRRMAARQVLGWCLNGQLLIGLYFVFSDSGQTSVGDAFTTTTVVRAGPSDSRTVDRPPPCPPQLTPLARPRRSLGGGPITW
jgi:uncharacterized RDD family membrane protein YckC